MLKILVCVKQVPDVDQMRMDPETGNLIRAGVPAILNPLDGNALAAALSVKEQYGAELSLITMGPPAAEAALRECLAAGADRAILVTDRAFGNADTLATSYSIVSAAKSIDSFDLIFCGKETLDGGHWPMAPAGRAFRRRPGDERQPDKVRGRGRGASSSSSASLRPGWKRLR